MDREERGVVLERGIWIVMVGLDVLIFADDLKELLTMGKGGYILTFNV